MRLEWYLLRVMRALVCLWVVTAAVARAELKVPPLTDAERAKLEKGEVVVHDKKPTDDKGVSAESLGLIDAPVDEVWPIIRDCQHFAKFLPNMKASARKEENGESLCFDELALPFPLKNLWADTKSTVVHEGEAWQRSWTFVRGTYEHNRGAWTLLPWGEGGKKTLVVYFIDSNPSMAIPDFIIRAAQTGSLPKVFTGIRQRVVALREQN